MQHKFHYKPEIDGLRAIAVIAVVLFHYFPENFQSGYLGVDLFFVISGFLITSIIYNDLNQKTFSLIGFWYRRVIRLLPALSLVLILVWVTGWLILLPSEYTVLGKHMIGSVFFFQNFVLWNEVGYFDADALKKPLLHLWSLSIEEQFYIGWPLLILVFVKRKFLLLLASAFITFASIFIALKYTQSSYPAHFYLPFGRVWELSSGALLAYIVHFCPYQKLGLLKQIRYFSNLLFFFSLLTILGLLFLSSKQTSHETKTLFVVIATVAIIFASEKSRLQKIISFPLLVYIGKISYPLYLFHWPILSLSFIQFGDLSLTHRLILIFISILCSALTYKFIELPIQNSAKNAAKSYYAIRLVALLMCVGVIAASTQLTEGFKGRFDFDISKIEGALSDWKALNDGGYNIILPPGVGVKSNTPEAPEILFIGDSFAVQYFPKVMSLTRNGLAKNIAFLTNQGCFPIKDFRSNSAPCGPFFEESLSILSHNKSIKMVILALAWNRLCENVDAGFGIEVKEEVLNVASGEFGKNCFDMFVDLIKVLSKDHEVYVIAAQPVGQKFSPDRVLYKEKGGRYFPLWTGWEEQSMNFPLSEKFKAFEKKFAAAMRKTEVKVIWPSKTICPEDTCQPFALDGEPKYHDNGHFRSKYIISEFDSITKILTK